MSSVRVVGSQANFFSDAVLLAQRISLMQQTSSALAKFQDLQNLHLTDSTATNVTEMSDIASEDVGCGPWCSDDHGNPEFYDSSGGEVYPSLAVSVNTVLHVDHTHSSCAHNLHN